MIKETNVRSSKFRRAIFVGLWLGFAGVSTAQQIPPQPAWAGATPVEVPEWGTSDEQGNCQSVPGTTQVSCRYFSGAQQVDIDLLDGAANRPGLQMKRTGMRFYGFPRGTPGTVEMRRFMFCSVSLDCSQPAATIYSHFIQPEQVYNDAGELIANPNFAQYRSPAVASYIVDQGYNGFNVVLPIRRKIGDKSFQFCPSGTQEIRKWYNAAFQRSVSTPGYKNDGNWRFTSNFSWRDDVLPRGYESSYDDELFCGPAQAKSVWVNNAGPADLRLQNGEIHGSYVSRFDLATGARSDFSTPELITRSGSFDQSRNVYWAAGQSIRSTLRIQGDNNLITHIDANFPSNRVTVLNDERSGNLLQLDTFAHSNRAWILDHRQPINANPELFMPPSTDTFSASGVLQTATLGGRIEGDVFFRLASDGGFFDSRVEAWDLRTKTRLDVYRLVAQLTVATGPTNLMPEISYSALRNTAYVVAPHTGRLFAVDFSERRRSEIRFPEINYRICDIEIDNARDTAYLLLRATLPGVFSSQDSKTVRSLVYELNLENLAVTRQVEIGIGGWQLAMAPIDGYMHLFVSNHYDGGDSGNDSFSQISTKTFTEVRRLQTQNQPTSIQVQLAD